MRLVRLPALGLCFTLLIAAFAVPASAEDTVSYSKQIRPLFQAHCQGCHQPAKPQGDYVITSHAAAIKAGESESPAIVPGKPDESYLVDLITPEKGEAEMPKGKKPLADAEIALIKTWIAEGAKDDSPTDASPAFSKENPPVYSVPPAITSIEYSPDGKLIAVAGFHEVLLHKADGSGIVGRLVGMSERIESLRFSPDGKRIVVAAGNPARSGEIQVWDVESQALTLSHPVTYDTLFGANWSPDGKTVSFGCTDKSVRAIDAETGKQVLFQGSHSDWPLDTVYSVDGSHVISVSRDRTVKLTEFATQRFIDNVTSITPGALSGGVNAIDRHPEIDVVLVGGADGTPKVYRIHRVSKRVIGDDANLIRRFETQRGRIFGVAFSPTGKQLAAVSSLNGTGELRLHGFDIKIELPDDVKKIAEKRVTQMTEAEKQRLAKFQTENVKQIAATVIDETPLYAVTYAPDGNTLAVAGGDGQIRLVNAADGKVQSSFSAIPVPADAASQQVARELRPRRDESLEPESLPPGTQIASIKVEPESVHLTARFDTVQFVVTANLKDGTTLDVTRMAQASLSNNLVALSPRQRLHAKQDGQTEITFAVGGFSAKVNVNVEAFASEFHPDFIHDVNPAITKMGCNAGTCHGAAKGKAGLKLSLRGNDAEFDVRAFGDDLAGRRVNLASADKSLMLLKASATVPHQGGLLSAPGEPHYEIVRQWIQDGVKLNLDAVRVASVELFPKNPIVQKIGGKQQFRLLATYTDGAVKDVTADSFITSGDSEIALIDGGALVTAIRRGESSIQARFEGSYAATTMTVMGNRSEFVWKQPESNNFVDDLVWEKLKRIKTLPSGLCTDAEFVRRVHLDLTGLPPTSEQVKKFLADPRPTREKRDALVDALIGNDDFVDHWTNKWADMLQVNRKFLGTEGTGPLRSWIREQIASNTPYDKFVYSILTAEGSNKENPAASYFKILRTPQDTMENTTHLFLAVRFNCNKCHDHPFERWTQDQYYETAAYFAQVGLKKDPAAGDKQIGRTAVEAGKPLFEIVFDKDSGDVTHERTGKVAPPQFPYEVNYKTAETATRRQQLASWITSSDNQYFAMSYVNRLWSYMTGTGIIEPIDDIRAGNPPTNPALLDRLTAEFVESGFDVRHMLRLICKSRVYQLSVATNHWNEDDKLNYSHARARRLPAEVLYDTVHRVTGSVSKIPGVPAGTRAAQLPDAGAKLPSGFLAKFGRPVRESACECERSTGMQLGPIMSLVSGPTVDSAINDKDNEIAKLVASQPDDKAVIRELFVRILNREATDAEVQSSLALFQGIEAEDALLKQELAEYEKEIAPTEAARQKAWQERVDKVKTELAAYEKEIAPREAELNKQQKERTAKLEAELKAYEDKLPELVAAWEAKADRGTVWVPLDPTTLTSKAGAKFEKQDDLSFLATGNRNFDTYTFAAPTDLQGVRGVLIEALTDSKLPSTGPGRSPDGNFVLTEFEAAVAAAEKPQEQQKITLQNAQADFSQSNYDVKTAIDGKRPRTNNGWAVAPQQKRNHRAAFEFKEPTAGEGSSILTFTLDQQFSSRQHTLGRFRISVTNSPGPIQLNGLPPAIVAVLDTKPEERNDDQKKQLLDYYRNQDQELQKKQQAVADSKKPRPTDPKLVEIRERLALVSKPRPIDSRLAALRRAAKLSSEQLENRRLVGAQDVTWALINSPAFLFNH